MAFARRGSGTCPPGRHHLVWFDGYPMRIGCAHCSFEGARIDLSRTTTPELVDALVVSSRAGHARLCGHGNRRNP